MTRGSGGFQTGDNFGSLVRRSSTTVLQDKDSVSELIIKKFFDSSQDFSDF